MKNVPLIMSGGGEETLHVFFFSFKKQLHSSVYVQDSEISEGIFLLA